MPSAITHAVTGAAISLLAPARYRGVGLAVLLAAAAAAPDLDVIGFRVGIPYAHPLGHRGFSHSLCFALLAALPIAIVVSRGGQWGRAEWGLFAVTAVALASHGLLDALTDAGLGVGFFVPFDNHRYFLPWRPVRTSPLSLRAFFGDEGIAILRNEVMWIWIPTACAVVTIIAVRRRRTYSRGVTS